MNHFYRDSLKEAWQTTKKLRFLWFFGAFASLTANGEEYDIIVRNFDTVTNLEEKIQSLRDLFQEGILKTAWTNLGSFFTDNIFSSLVIIFAGLLVTAAMIYLITISQAAIINGANRFRRGEKSEFFDGFIIGTKKFWPIFVLNLLAKVIIYGLIIVCGVPLTLAYLYSGRFLYLGIFSLIAFLILIPLQIFISFTIKYALIHIILKGQKVTESIMNSLRFFRKNWLITFEIALILYVINFVITFFIVGTLTFTTLPFSRLGYLLFMAILIFVGALIATFQFTTWTNLFVNLNEGKGMSKIARLLKDNFGKDKKTKSPSEK